MSLECVSKIEQWSFETDPKWEPSPEIHPCNDVNSDIVNQGHTSSEKCGPAEQWLSYTLMLRCKSNAEVMSPYAFSSFSILFNRKRRMSGARQSLNTKQISHLACPSWTLHLWTSVALTKNSVWTLAQSVSNKWTQPKLNNRKTLKIFLFAISSLFLTESWILPCLLCTYILNCGQKRRTGQSSVQYDPIKSPPLALLQNICDVVLFLFLFFNLTPVVEIVNLCKKTKIKNWKIK